MSDEQTPVMPTELAEENPHAAEFAVLEALKAEVESLKDQRLRALAEAENVRRRADKERAEASQYAVTKFARDMLGIADNFARALAACPPAVRDAADAQVKARAGRGGSYRPAIGGDVGTLWRSSRWKPKASSIPTCIQAIAEVPGNGKPAGSIVDVMQSGFMIGDPVAAPGHGNGGAARSCERPGGYESLNAWPT